MNQTTPQPAEQAFPMAELAMDFLRKDADGEERLSFCAQGAEALEVGLGALFLSGQPVRPALEELLGLALVLQEQEESPTAALLIRGVVSANPQALRALGIQSEDGGVARRATARLLGGQRHEQAPVFGMGTPEGATKAAALIDPLALDRNRLGAKANLAPKARPATPVTKQETPKAPKTRRRFDVC